MLKMQLLGQDSTKNPRVGRGFFVIFILPLIFN